MKSMTQEEAREFRARWHLVSQTIAEEIRNALPETRLQQLRTIFASAHAIFQTRRSVSEEQEVRNRWLKLKQRLNV